METVSTMLADPASAPTPLSTLRRLLDRRISELAAQSAKTERDLTATLHTRERLYAAMRQNAGVLGSVLSGATRVSLDTLIRALHDGLSLHSDRAALEERILEQRSRGQFLAQERALLEAVERTIGGRGGGTGGVDFRGARLSQAARNIFHIVEDEHEALAHDILDGPMQRLSDAAMDAELAGRVMGRDRATANESLRRCRVATAEAAAALDQRLARLAPVDGEHRLPDALRLLLDRAVPGRQARLVVFGTPRPLTRAADLTAFRTVEAAVDNALRHGRARHVEVVLSYHRERATLVVKDDGEGFDVVATEARLGRMRGLGMIEMHERARIAGGRLEVRSQTGAGTEVHLTLPA
ncbi:MAG TPA: ATP-binding protein [Candidatus Dormibacteraeota bacterium]